MADDASSDCKVRIIEVQLSFRHVELSDEKYRGIQPSLPLTPTRNPTKLVVMKTRRVAQGISCLNWENTRVSQLPNRVFMAMVDNDGHTGSIAKNLFSFKHFNSSQVVIYLNGEMSAPPLKLNSANNQYIYGY